MRYAHCNTLLVLSCRAKVHVLVLIALLSTNVMHMYTLCNPAGQQNALGYVAAAASAYTSASTSRSTRGSTSGNNEQEDVNSSSGGGHWPALAHALEIRGLHNFYQNLLQNERGVS